MYQTPDPFLSSLTIYYAHYFIYQVPIGANSWEGSFWSGEGDSKDLKDVVLVDIEEVWQIGFLMDKIDDELSAVYIPGAPNPMSGDVFFVKNDRLKKLDLPELSAMKIYKKLGLDAKSALRGEVSKSSF